MTGRRFLSFVTILLVSLLAGLGFISCEKAVEAVTEILFTNEPNNLFVHNILIPLEDFDSEEGSDKSTETTDITDSITTTQQYHQ